MQVRATLLPSELKEAALIHRRDRFWFSFLRVNWYRTAVCLAVLAITVKALFGHQAVDWGFIATLFVVDAFFIWLSWYRWGSRLAKAAKKGQPAPATLTLDPDGVRSTSLNGTFTLVPWSTFSAWKEGKSIFLLIGDSPVTVPIENGSRESIRSVLRTRIS